MATLSGKSSSNLSDAAAGGGSPGNSMGQIPLVTATEWSMKSGKLDNAVSWVFDEDLDTCVKFILAFPQFVTAQKVWNLLKQKIDERPAGPPSTPAKHSSINDDILAEPIDKPFLFLSRWLEVAFTRDFLNSKELYRELLALITKMGNTEVANRLKLLILKNAVETRSKGRKTPQMPRKSPNDSPTSVPSSPRRGNTSTVDLRLGGAEKKAAKLEPGKFDIQDLDPLLLAQQLTAIEAEIFYKIKDSEWFHTGWRKENPDRNKVAPNIVKMVDRFNKVSYWIATEIVMATVLKDRVNILKKFIQVAEHLRDMGNYNGLMEIVAGMNIWSVTRLKETWEQLPPAAAKSVEDINQLMENKQNYKNYRQILKTARLPLIPYVGLYLRDLTFIEENPDWIGPKEDGVINMEKCNLIAQVIMEAKRFQSVPFPIEKDTALINYLSKLLTLPEEMLYKHSLLCEPLTNNAPQP